MSKILNILKKIKKQNKLFFVLIFIIFFCIFNTYRKDSVQTFLQPYYKTVILLDAGHGGYDPGKVSQDDVLEKDINLAITKKLQTYLEQAGFFVLNTRVDDDALSSEKNEDLKERKKIANEDGASLLISIHQNSFTNENVEGAQVFYYKNSKESEKIAKCIQARLKEIDKDNDREAKANESYYLLKKTDIPAIIIECGFLSNEEEKNKLVDEEYQEEIAWAIHLGIIDYYKEIGG